MSRRNETAARNRRRLHEGRIVVQDDRRRKEWHALAWLSAEAKLIPDPDAALDLLTGLAAEMNERNAKGGAS